jgi:hypothetical protein
MEIRITGWGYENIRKLNTLDVDLLSKDGLLPHATLVMMKNGTGKTTTLRLMRAALSGNATTWTENQVRDYRPTNSDEPIGKFYVKMKFGDKQYTFFLILDYDLGVARYETSRVERSGGLEDGHNLPASMRYVLNSDGFVERFIFDGEQAKKMLKASEKEAENAVWYLYQIDKLLDLKKRIETLMQKKQSESKVATNQGLKNVETRRDKAKQQYDVLVQKQDKLKGGIKQAEEQQKTLEKQRQKLVEADESLKNQQQQLSEEKEKQESNITDALQSVGMYTKNPFYVSAEFERRLVELTQNMNTLELPKTIAREFFNEIAESEDCICGRKIGPDEKATILQRAEQYLGADDLIAINTIKDKLRNYSKDSGLKDAIAEMIAAKECRIRLQGELNRLVLKLDEDAIKESDKIKGKLDDLSGKIQDMRRELSELESPTNSSRATAQNNLQLAQKAYDEAEENYQRALGTYEYTQRSKTLMKYIEDTEKRTLEKLKERIIEKTNEKIITILSDDPILVKKIDGRLVLRDRSEASDGQTLAIAYSYIGSLFEHSSYEFPFVIDAPAAAMDLEVRREVATTIPKLFKQLIIFVTSGEREGFAEKFYSENKIKYLTIKGQNDGENAVCTEGQECFSTYQSEED